MRIKMLFAGNFEIEDHAIHLLKDEIIEVNVDDAARLVTGLCAELVSNFEETETETPAPRKSRKKAGDE